MTGRPEVGSVWRRADGSQPSWRYVVRPSEWDAHLLVSAHLWSSPDDDHEEVLIRPGDFGTRLVEATE